ncbi:Nidogen-like, partial [Pristimantis euphronides]
LLHPFSFFNEVHRTIYVNNNGALSFKNPVTTFTPDSFPLADHCMICPYWGDVDNECGGNITYRQSTEKEILNLLDRDINSLFENLNFKADWCFIATWYKVAYHGTESDKRNTFQTVLAADGPKSFVMFNYDDINWTTGTASGGDSKTGLGGTPAQAGFNTGKEYFNMPMSRTEHIINIKTTSNCGIPGRWIFRVDEFRVPGGCIH